MATEKSGKRLRVKSAPKRMANKPKWEGRVVTGVDMSQPVDF